MVKSTFSTGIWIPTGMGMVCPTCWKSIPVHTATPPTRTATAYQMDWRCLIKINKAGQIKGVYSQVLQDVLRRLDNGYQAFFRRVKNGETPGFPKFKKHGEWNSITYPQYHAFPGSRIKIPKVGIVKTVHHRQIPKEAKIKTKMGNTCLTEPISRLV